MNGECNSIGEDCSSIIIATKGFLIIILTSYYVTLCVGRSKAFVGQYILPCFEVNIRYIALEPGQYLDIAREGGF